MRQLFPFFPPKSQHLLKVPVRVMLCKCSLQIFAPLFFLAKCQEAVVGPGVCGLSSGMSPSSQAPAAAPCVRQHFPAGQALDQCPAPE